MLCELQNPWHLGRWSGRWSEGSAELLSRRGHRQLRHKPESERCRPFWMSIQDFCQHFTHIVAAKLFPAFWHSCAVTCSNERPSYPLLSTPASTEAVFVLSQPDRRWAKDQEYSGAIGLKVYRCRIVALPQHAVGARQNVSSPFTNLELVAEKELTKARTVMVEIPRLEPDCLYLVAPEMEGPVAFAASLRALAARAPRFRELSAPESSYFLQAQPSAPRATDADSFSSEDSAELSEANDIEGAPPRDPMRQGAAEGGVVGGGGGGILGSWPGGQWQDWAGEGDDGEATKLPSFLKACMASGCFANGC